MEAVVLWAATEATAAGRAMAETAVAVARVAEVRVEGAAVGMVTAACVVKAEAVRAMVVVEMAVAIEAGGVAMAWELELLARAAGKWEVAL